MLTIRNELNEKIEESNILLQHINDISSQSKSVQRTSILKSAYMLLLYNIIESMIRLIFEEIHDELSRYTYNQLSSNIKNVYINYYSKKNPTINMETFDVNNLNVHYFPQLEEYLKNVTLYSGNLDARKINEISKKYNIGEINSPSKKHLLIVKTKRNKLAHGEEKFKASCRGYTTTELEILQNAINEFMNELLIIVEEYLNNKRYLNDT